MIETLSQTEADRRHLGGPQVKCISPYLNPAHVLAPPRYWLEALVRGEYSWAFFRLRYKTLLRKRFKAEPERFHALLDASEGERSLVLTCHCLTEHCHRAIAAEFLEALRRQRPLRQVHPPQVRPRVPATPSGVPAPVQPAAATATTSPKPRRRAAPTQILATLIEPPQAIAANG